MCVAGYDDRPLGAITLPHFSVGPTILQYCMRYWAVLDPFSKYRARHTLFLEESLPEKLELIISPTTRLCSDLNAKNKDVGRTNLQLFKHTRYELVQKSILYQSLSRNFLNYNQTINLQNKNANFTYKSYIFKNYLIILVYC